MSIETTSETVQTLREIRDGQREIIALLQAQHALAAEQLARSGERMTESMELQRIAMRRARAVTAIAFPAILVCLAAIGYLVARYF